MKKRALNGYTPWISNNILMAIPSVTDKSEFILSLDIEDILQTEDAYIEDVVKMLNELKDIGGYIILWSSKGKLDLESNKRVLDIFSIFYNEMEISKLPSDFYMSSKIIKYDINEGWNSIVNNIPSDANIISIDFDGTIVEDSFPKIGNLMPGAKNSLFRLKEDGKKIYIWSSRMSLNKTAIAREMNVVQKVRDYLNKNKIPYDKILDTQTEESDLFIDDRGLAFDSRKGWDGALRDIRNMIEKPEFESVIKKLKL